MALNAVIHYIKRHCSQLPYVIVLSNLITLKIIVYMRYSQFICIFFDIYYSFKYLRHLLPFRF